MPNERNRTLDVIIPLFNEEPVAAELRDRLRSTLDAMGTMEWRVLFVNDGSDDGSRQLLRRFHEEDHRFCLVNLSRNFGHQAALAAGLSYARADAVILMDGDLQDPPELIPDLVREWREGGTVVLVKRSGRRERGLRRMGFDLFHRFINSISDFPLDSHTGTFSLLDRRAAAELSRFREGQRFLPGLRSWIGFSRRYVYHDRPERAGGPAKQDLRRLAAYALDAMLSFSRKPLRYVSLIGFLTSAIGFLIGAYFIIKRLLGYEVAQVGFTTIITLIVFLGGMQLIALGILGEYVGRSYEELKARPLFIVNDTVGIENGSGDDPSAPVR